MYICIHTSYIYIYIYIYGFSIPYRKLARVGFEIRTHDLVLTVHTL